MIVDAEFTMTIKISDFIVHSKLSEEERMKALIEEGEKRARYYLSGYLFDPNGKNMKKNVIIQNIKQ